MEHEYVNSGHCPACVSQYNKIYAVKNRERKRAATAIYRANNRIRLAASLKEYRDNHPEKGHEAYRLLKERRPIYTIWNNMTGRCLNPNDEKYPAYGGRGITVCDRWSGPSGYQNFEADMSPRPSGGHSIDRINNSKGYSPENCKWSTRKEQQRNMRSNRLVTIGSRTLCVSAWVEEYGILRSTFMDRLGRGQTGERLLRPVDVRFRHKT